MYDHSAAFYSFFAEPAALPSMKASMVLSLLKGEFGAGVLDVGSGPGDIAFELAASGVSVTCVEPMSAMRSVFLSRLIDRRDLDGRLTLLDGDAMTLALDARYRVVCAFSLLFLLKNHEEQSAALRSLGGHLTKDGVLVTNFLLNSPAEEVPRQLKGERILGETIYRHFSGKTFRAGVLTCPGEIGPGFMLILDPSHKGVSWHVRSTKQRKSFSIFGPWRSKRPRARLKRKPPGRSEFASKR